jgi:hypothetical protein
MKVKGFVELFLLHSNSAFGPPKRENEVTGGLSG